jgi:aldose 1-epimerase
MGRRRLSANLAEYAVNTSLEADLAVGALRVTVSPQAGGRIARFWRETENGPIHILQPMSAGMFDPFNWPKAGCYPLVPFSNRIRGGCFVFEGRQRKLTLHPGTPDALHGFAQRRAWTIAAKTASSLTMAYTHSPDEWDWAFEAAQRLDLFDDALSVTLSVRNTSPAPMPVGFGLHPYFAISLGDRIAFDARYNWAIDDGFIAIKREAKPTHYDAPQNTAGRTDYLSGWSRAATIARADGTTIRLGASEALDHFVFHVPDGGAYLCLEPVSHVADAFNLAASGHEGTGLRVLAPGETVEVTVRMEIETRD